MILCIFTLPIPLHDRSLHQSNGTNLLNFIYIFVDLKYDSVTDLHTTTWKNRIIFELRYATCTRPP